MLPKHKKILITSETHEQVSVQKSRLRLQKIVCPLCETNAEMLTLDSAVTLSGVSTRQLIEFGELGKIHSIETTSGHLLFCRHSLENFSQEQGV